MGCITTVRRSGRGGPGIPGWCGALARPRDRAPSPRTTLRRPLWRTRIQRDEQFEFGVVRDDPEIAVTVTAADGVTTRTCEVTVTPAGEKPEDEAADSR